MNTASPDPETSRRVDGVFLGLAGLFALWAGLKATGRWVSTGDLLSFDLVHSLVFVLAAGLALFWWVRRPRSEWMWRDTSPAHLLMLYGVVAFVATLALSPNRAVGAYWGALFLAATAVFVVAATSSARPHAERNMVRATWLIVGGLCVLFFVLGAVEYGLLDNALSVQRRFALRSTNEWPWYWSNSNGLGRFWALAAIIAFARVLRPARGDGGVFTPTRLGWLALFAIGTFGVATTVSRSSIGGLVVALALVALFRFGWKAVAGGAVAVAVAAVPLDLASNAWAVFQRGQTAEQLAAFSGRTPLWSAALDHVASSPIIGYGFHADRLLIGNHMHNAWLHALLQGGALGLVLFVGAWVLVGVALVRLGLFRGFRDQKPIDRGLLVEVTAVLAFFLLRSVPESTGAFFGVDLLILGPLFIYVHGLWRAQASAAYTSAQASTGNVRPHVLVCAYACAPPGSPTFYGGEELLGWKMATQAPKFGRATVLVSGEHRESIEGHLASQPIDDVECVFVDLPRWMGPLRRVQGGIQFYAYAWQAKAFLVAEALHADDPVDVFHHLTYGNDWMASHIGALLPVPYVRGPGGGAHKVPRRFRSGRGLRFRLAQWWRGGMQRVLRADPFFRLGHARASRILVCNREAMAQVPRRWRDKVQYFPVNGIDSDAIVEPEDLASRGEFTVITVGKLLPIKGFDLAIEAFARFSAWRPNTRFVIVGDGPERQRLEDLAFELDVQHKVEFVGWRDHADVLGMMRRADAFLFPSLRDGGGAVVVEAFASGLPVVCLDVAGPGLHVTADTGFAVPATDPRRAVRDMSTALERLHSLPALRRHMQAHALARARSQYQWEHLGDRMVFIYRDAVAGRHGGTPPQQIAATGRDPNRARHSKPEGGEA